MRKAKDLSLKFCMKLCTGITCLILLGLIGYLLYRGMPGISGEFLTTQTSYIKDTVGILPNILNTLYLILLVMLIVVPLGVGAAVYLTEYASDRRITNAVGFAVETLTGIPSIIFGLVGMLFFTQILGLRQGILTGALTLIIMVLPTIINNSKESLLAVPQSYREGSLALGSGKWHMVRTVVLPNAVDGIVTGCILAVGRVVGESAALLFTAGFGLKLLGFADALQSSAATLSVALYIYANEEGKFDVAFSIAVILIAVTLIINLASTFAGRKLKHGKD
ncbi:MAG: phosphate ABC transporter permease PstA [Oscillospiraceae bacterium]|nr:phosphate ABC transporter permease PstA [Oscillospiraceae bacterium]